MLLHKEFLDLVKRVSKLEESTMTDQELKLELLRIAKAQNPHEMGNSPLDVAETYYQWVIGNVTFEEENMTPPGFHEQEFIKKWKELSSETGIVWDETIKQQVQSIIKTAQSELQKYTHYPPEGEATGIGYCHDIHQLQIYKNAFNKLLEL